MKHKILILDRFHETGLKILRNQPNLDITHQVSPELNTNQNYEHDILITRSRTKINSRLLELLPNLKLVISVTSGFDHIDLNAIKAHKLQVEYCPEANADSAAELAWGLLLSTTRNIPQAHTQVTKGLWRNEHLIGRTLKDSTLLIIGFGRIGKRVANFAHAFGLKIIVCDPYVENLPSWADAVTLEEGLKNCDIVSLHVPKTNKTFHLLHADNLSLLSPHAILINTSRGDVVEEKALLHALASKSIRAAGLDVFAKEPLAENSMYFELKNVVLSPHAGAFTEDAYKLGAIQCAEKVLAFLKGEPASHPLPPQTAWVNDLDTLP